MPVGLSYLTNSLLARPSDDQVGGEAYTVNYSQMVVPIIAALQQERVERLALQARVETLVHIPPWLRAGEGRMRFDSSRDQRVRRSDQRVRRSPTSTLCELTSVLPSARPPEEALTPT